MKKKNIFAIAFGAFAIAMGFSSCKKNRDCVEISKDGETDCFCVEDADGNRDAFDAYVKLYKASGYKVKYVKSCPEDEEEEEAI